MNGWDKTGVEDDCYPRVIPDHADSFDPTIEQIFSATDGGHADAVGRAIKYLSTEILPKAIQKDHQLHDDGVRPPESDFGKGES